MVEVELAKTGLVGTSSTVYRENIVQEDQCQASKLLDDVVHTPWYEGAFCVDTSPTYLHNWFQIDMIESYFISKVCKLAF